MRLVSNQKSTSRSRRGKSGSDVATSRGTVAITSGLTRDPFAQYFRANPWPPRQKKIFNFSRSFLLTSSLTAETFGTEYLLALNDAAQPDSSGNVPYGWGTYLNLYNRYRVDAAEIDVQFTAPTQSCYPAAAIQASSDAFTLTSNTIDTSLQYPGCFGQPLSSTGEQSARFTQRIQMHQLEGLTKPEYDAAVDQYAALTTTGPALPLFLRLALANYLDADASSCIVILKVAFHVTLYDRNQATSPP